MVAKLATTSPIPLRFSDPLSLSIYYSLLLLPSTCNLKLVNFVATMASSAFVHYNNTITSATTIQSSSSTTKLHEKPNDQLSMSPKQSKWASISTDVETHIKKAIAGHEPASMFELLHHLTFAPPRSMAPALCVSACEFVGGQKEQAIPAASALHLMHAAAFTHENLPLSDRTVSRRMIDHVYGPNIELLTGDGILPLGYELLAKSADYPACNGDSVTLGSEKILRVIIEIARATGSQGLVDGQYRQISGMELEFADGDMEWINHVTMKKEGELYACGTACGAILGGATDKEIEIFRRFGFYIGMMHGMILHATGNAALPRNKWLEEVERFRSMALKELERLEDKNVDAISKLVDECFVNDDMN